MTQQAGRTHTASAGPRVAAGTCWQRPVKRANRSTTSATTNSARCAPHVIHISFMSKVLNKQNMGKSTEVIITSLIATPFPSTQNILMLPVFACTLTANCQLLLHTAKCCCS
jgi:hypothetical protein